MSPRLVAALVLTGIVSFGAGAGTSWTLLQLRAAAQSGVGAGAKPAFLSGRQEKREKFFNGDPERSIRGGQELKPRW